MEENKASELINQIEEMTKVISDKVEEVTENGFVPATQNEETPEGVWVPKNRKERRAFEKVIKKNQAKHQKYFDDKGEAARKEIKQKMYKHLYEKIKELNEKKENENYATNQN